jgi:succinate dehydrogenase / fumarate reductase, cytochrome b subunit
MRRSTVRKGNTLSSATTLSHGTTTHADIRPFLLRRLHSLTGIVFGGYLVVHLLINATLAQGTRPHDVYGMQVYKIHSLPFLPVIEWTFIYLPILFHTVYGIYLTVRAQPNTGHYPYAKNWFYLLQRISAVIIVFFMLFHVLSLKYHLFGSNYGFDANAATATIRHHMAQSFFVTWILYPTGILASCYHLANGFWTAAITWGLTVSKGAQRRWGYACAGLFALTFIAGITALIATVALTGDPTPAAAADVHR